MVERLLKLIYKDRNFYKIVAAMMVPVALQNMITIGVNITDTMMLGALGKHNSVLLHLLVSILIYSRFFCMGTSMGASVLALLFSIPGIWALDWIMRMYTEDETIIREGVAYMGFAVPTFFFHGLSQASTIILRSIKKVKLPLYTLIGAFLLNIAGNYIFIFGKCGLPMLGIAGASLSTLLVRIFECAMNFGYLVLVEKEVKFRIPHLFMKTGELLPEYI